MAEMKQEKTIHHLAIIMDGNRRWAKENGKSVKEGHEAGINKLTEVISWCIDNSIKYLTVYAFSTENWQRNKDEIDNIMFLIKWYLKNKSDELSQNGVKVKIIGIEDNIDTGILKEIQNIEHKTKNNDKIQLNIAFNYGGRREILDVTKNIAQDFKNNQISLDDINENLFSRYLYYGNIPNPDLMIRPGKEIRISNFLLWEIAYTEFMFEDFFWPEMTRENFENIINNFKYRDRRYGGK